MATGKEILAVAAREIGYHEGSGKRNKFGEWYGMNNVAWCMQFVQWVYAQAWAKLPFKTASCGSLLRYYRDTHPECITKEPVEGCIVIFDFPGGAATDHTGIFVTKTETTITTIDGNTSGLNDSNGGWVQQKTRALSYARPTYIVPKELTKEDDMRRYNTLEEIKKEANWAYATIKKLCDARALNGDGAGLNLSYDMIRILVVLDRTGALG